MKKSFFLLALIVGFCRIQAQITAQFSIANIDGLTVIFKDESSYGGCTPKASWDFGDPSSSENTSAELNPTHVFSEAGTYNVCLNALSDFACLATSDMVCMDVTVVDTGSTMTTSHESIIAREATFLVYPNPVTDIFQLSEYYQFDNGDIEVSLCSITGNYQNTLYRGKGALIPSTFDIGSAAKGLYFLIIKTDQHQLVRKVMKR